MRKVLLVLTLFVAAFSGFAQKQYKKKPVWGLHITFNDFATAKVIKDDGFSKAFKGKEWYNTSNMSVGGAVSFHKGITNNIDWSMMLGLTTVDYPFTDRGRYGTREALFTLDGNVQFKLLDDRHVVTPYINLGIGAYRYRRFAGFYAPLGLGLQGSINGLYIFANTQYRLGLTKLHTEDYLFHSIGVAGDIFTPKQPKPVAPITPPVVEPKDTDKDGVIDDNDDCPTEAGPASLKGCPDKDGDGIADKKDKCPDVAGVAKYEGCPVPDRDKDGIADDEDKCPDQAGFSRYQGCPIPDGDGDSVNDEEDRCPTVPGIVANQGCPEVKDEVKKQIDFAAKNILFATGSAKLLATSNKHLNEVVKVMEGDADLKLSIEGHADNTGAPERNQQLSDERAAAVKAYLVSKGIDESRISSQGFGDSNPIADNKTAAGRAKNRRVELKLSY
jgi:OmpA-OmpF porin, OOP family